MITVQITETGKSFNPREKFSIFNVETLRFKDMVEAKSALAMRYPKCKRVPMYRDGKDGVVKKVGYVYGFHNADWSHSPVKKWIQQDWVCFSECREVVLEQITH